LVVVLLVVAQLVLPGIAAAASGSAGAVGEGDLGPVSAFPAIELLWHQAGEVDVRLASYHAATGGDLAVRSIRRRTLGRSTRAIDELNTGLVTLCAT
jgi:hypothetical protein